jgi:hypothetical protein
VGCRCYVIRARSSMWRRSGLMRQVAAVQCYTLCSSSSSSFSVYVALLPNVCCILQALLLRSPALAGCGVCCTPPVTTWPAAWWHWQQWQQTTALSAGTSAEAACSQVRSINGFGLQCCVVVLCAQVTHGVVSDGCSCSGVRCLQRQLLL